MHIKYGINRSLLFGIPESWKIGYFNRPHSWSSLAVFPIESRPTDQVTGVYFDCLSTTQIEESPKFHEVWRGGKGNTRDSSHAVLSSSLTWATVPVVARLLTYMTNAYFWPSGDLEDRKWGGEIVRCTSEHQIKGPAQIMRWQTSPIANLCHKSNLSESVLDPKVAF